MFLLHINNKINKTLIMKVKQLNLLEIKLTAQTNRFGLSKKSETFEDVFRGINLLEFQNEAINYVIGISFLTTNLRFYLVNTKGQMIFSFSAGLVGISKKQRNRKISLIIKLIHLLKINSIVVKDSLVALHLHNFTKFFLFFTLNSLKKHFNIGFIKILNSYPYNGCRPKKIKRLKHRKVRF